MRARLFAVLVVAAACKPTKPLPEAILGRWDRWCATDAVAETECLGRDDTGLYTIFHAGGKIVTGAVHGTEMSGRWLLNKSELHIEFEGSGMKLAEDHFARIDHDRLILWNRTMDFGAVYGRAGAEFEAAASPETPGGRTKGELAGVRYAIELPAGYRLTRDDNDRQRWGPRSGSGFEVALTVSPRAQTEVDGKWVTPPCNPHDYGGVSSSLETVAGVERKISIGNSVCLEDSDHVLMCSAEHSRGHLESGEEDAALALCTSLRVE